ncbi:MAG: hypothetical protein WBW59_03240, partial [Pseudolabrys sp.]
GVRRRDLGDTTSHMSAIGTKRTCRVALHMSAFGGKADIAVQTRGCQSLNFFKDLIGRLHGGYIAASSLPSR